MVPKLLLRAGRRHLQRHPWQLGLSVVGVALGVAVAVSVDLANGSALRAFAVSTEALTGSATHRIVGGTGGLPERLLVELRVARGLRAAAPVVEGFVALPARSGRTLRLLGIDPFAEGALRPALGGELASVRGRRGRGLPLVDLLDRRAVAMTMELAAELDLGAGDDLDVRVGGRRSTVRIATVFEPGDGLARAGLRDVLVADLATAQELLGMRGVLSRIDLRLPDGVASIEDALPAAARIEPAGARADSALAMSRAFRLNLRAMSLLAMLCGAFLIYNTMVFSVLRRRRLLGVLRALGVQRDEVLWLVLSEAVGIGIVGTLLGLAGGVALGRGLVGLVAGTVNDFYFAVTVRELALSPASLLMGAALGLGATVAAAWFPAREATRVTPRAALTRSAVEVAIVHDLRRRATAATLAVAAGVLLLLIPSAGLVAAFAGLFAIVLGATLAVPGVIRWLARAFGGPARRLFGSFGAMTVGGVVSSLSRTGVAVAALMVAVAVVIGVGVMVSSFRITLVRWLDYTLQADLYVAPAGAEDGVLRLDDEVRAAIESLAGVDRVRTLRGIETVADEAPASLLALEMGVEDREAYRFRTAVADAWERFDQGAILVSEPFEARRGIGAGDALVVATDRGPQSFEVAGVHYSYAADRGAILMRRETFERWFDDRSVNGLSVHAEAGTDLESLRSAVRERLVGQRLSLTTNRELRERSLEVFDRTFVITGVLRWLVALVAFVGVLSALMAIQIEGAREHALLRVAGLTSGQLGTLMVARSGLLGLFAGLLSVPLGIVLAWLMVHVINKRSFGWSLQMEIAPEILAQGIALALVAALLAGVYPALRMSRVAPALALREE